MRKKGGFTLIELLVVVIILGILAAIAIPKFMTGQEAARSAEAKLVLGAIRISAIAYQQTTGIWPTTFDAMGFNAGESYGMGNTASNVCNSRYWTFTYANAASDFNVVAARNTGVGAGASSGNICINKSGITYGNHPYANSAV